MKNQASTLQTVPMIPWLSWDDSTASHTGRLMVVISDVSEEPVLASRILEAARGRGLQVLLLGVASSVAAETALRRKLVTVSAFIAAESWPVSIQTEGGMHWIEKVRASYSQADQVACYAEQGMGIWGQPLSDVLSRALQVPILDFSALHADRAGRWSAVSEAFAWFGSLAAIAGFLLLQARIVLATQGFTQNALLLLTLLAEIGLIWLWNSLFG